MAEFIQASAPVSTDESMAITVNFNASKLFDGQIGNSQYWMYGATSGHWASWDYGAALPFPVVEYKLQTNFYSSDSANRMVRDWRLQGSHNGTDWTTIDTVVGETGWSASEQRTFTPDDLTTAYQHYRLYVDANNGDSYTICAEVRIYYADLTYDMVHTSSDGMVCAGDHGLVYFDNQSDLVHISSSGMIGGGLAIGVSPDALGYIFDDPFVDYVGKSINLDQWGAPPFNWLEDFPYVGDRVDSFSGPQTNTAPVDVTHWSGAGSIGYTGVEYWKQCLDLFMRWQ